MAQQKQRQPVFSRGLTESLLKAIQEGGVFYDAARERIIWHYCSDTGQLAFVTPGKTEEDDPIVEFMNGAEKFVQVVDSLPSTSDAEQNVLYIVDNTGYVYNGTEFVRLFDMSVNDQVTDLITAVSTLNTEISSIEQTLDERQVEFTNFSDALATWQAAAEQDISNLSDGLTQAQSDISGLTDRVTQTEQAVTTLENKSDDYEQRILANANGIDGLTTRVNGLETDVADIKGDISDLEARVLATEADITDLQTQDGILAQSIADIRTDLTALQGRVTTIESDISTLQNTLVNDYMDTPTTEAAINAAINNAMEIVEY